MPELATQIIDECVREIGDIAGTRITPSDWIQFYNDALELMTRRYRIIEQDATFDLVPTEDRYLYPADMVQMRWLKYSPTPSEVNTYKYISERDEDWVRNVQAWGKMDGDWFYGYLPRAQFFQLIPKPTTLVTDGGEIAYWKLAARISTSEGVELEVPSQLRLQVRERMVMFAKKRLTRYDEYGTDVQLWEAEMRAAMVTIEDRSDDALPRLKTRSERTRYRGMV